MPDRIRSTSVRSAASCCRVVRLLLLSCSGLQQSSTVALSATDNLPGQAAAYLAAFSALDSHEVAGLALTLGVLVFAVVTGILLVRTQARAAAAQSAARAQLLAMQDEVDRANALLLSEPQVLFVWAAGSPEPEILGDTALVTPVPVPRRALAFGTWLSAEDAAEMDRRVEALRSSGEAFRIPLTTLSDRFIEAEGRAIGGRAVLRLREVTGAKKDLLELTAEHQQLLADVRTLQSLIEALPSPIWARDDNDRLVWVNQAYARAVEARDPGDAVSQGLELLDRSAREQAKQARALKQRYEARVPVIVSGQRRMLDVIDIPSLAGSAGIGVDATEVETLRAELRRLADAQRRTLDQLSTGVAIFSADQTLVFYNAAYCALWDLDAAFLDQSPRDSSILDRLRAIRKLPEQTDFRVWKNELHEAYRAVEPKEHLWHLPDGRTLRVVTTPNPEGGVIYLFDDVTERLDLTRRYDALIRVQGETLDNLAEGVAVFGSDGRLRLFNPAFARLWKISPALLSDKPHIEAVIGWCRSLHADNRTWDTLRSAVTSLERRDSVSGRLERSDGTLVDYVTTPLPDGSTLLTIQDVTDTVNVERALRERTEALEAADALKSDFVHHVSYELRSPLTNIIGFAQLLDDPSTGPLSEKQREYLNYITGSSAALLAIINDILDLATIDAGAMTLELAPVHVRQTMEEAAEGVQDRLVEKNLVLDLQAPAQIEGFHADARRLRQILYNLLSNAVSFSPPGETITLCAEARSDSIVFSVQDRGPGIPGELIHRVFQRFETHPLGSEHRGAGLGLSIVRSLVELHGGKVLIKSAVGEGTTVTCVFPLNRAAELTAAE